MSFSIGFVVIGIILFPTSTLIDGFKSSFVILFCLMNGDSVLDVFDDLEKSNWLGLLFMILVIFFFVIILRTILTAIITDSFFNIVDSSENSVIRTSTNLTVNYEDLQAQIKMDLVESITCENIHQMDSLVRK